MAKPTRIRWECPNGLHPGVLGSSRPPLDSIVRYCLPCSQAEGKLIRRTAPALERKRAKGRERSAALTQRKRDRQRQAKADAVSALVYVNGVETKVRIDKMLEQVWRLPTRVAECPKEPVPEITVRRGTDGDASGRCHYDWRIVVTIGKCDLARAEALIIHEAAHQIAWGSGRMPRLSGPKRKLDHHGRLFRSINRALVTEWTGVPAPHGEGLSIYEFQVAMIEHLRAHPAP